MALAQPRRPPHAVVAMDAGEVRERDWANVVTAHEGDPKAYTWRLKDGCLGEWVLHPPRDRSDPVPNAPATAVSLSSCGNFALVGSASGRVDKYNMQSGIHRGAFQRHRVSRFPGMAVQPEADCRLDASVNVQWLL